MKNTRAYDSFWKIFRSPSEEYEKYCIAVALEFEGSDEYEKDRLKMLKTLLTIPYIFSLQIMRDKFEQQARKNIEAEIEKLSKQ
jgi:predicted metal-dependent HD superfamily phosphohydrolase